MDESRGCMIHKLPEIDIEAGREWVIDCDLMLELLKTKRYKALRERIKNLRRRILSTLKPIAMRIKPDDEIVKDDFHMERMDDDHIWFKVGDMAFDLYAVDDRIIWETQEKSWEELVNDSKTSS